jgi:hypothetical protein
MGYWDRRKIWCYCVTEWTILKEKQYQMSQWRVVKRGLHSVIAKAVQLLRAEAKCVRYFPSRAFGIFIQ